MQKSNKINDLPVRMLQFPHEQARRAPCKNQKCRYKTQSGLLDFGLFFLSAFFNIDLYFV